MTDTVHDYAAAAAYHRRNKLTMMQCHRCTEWHEARKGTKWCRACAIIVGAEQKIARREGRKEQNRKSQARIRAHNQDSKPYTGRVVNSSDIMQSLYGVTDRLINDILSGKVGLAK